MPEECGKVELSPENMPEGQVSKNRCKKCQSFCMLGHQLVRGSNTPSWNSWKNFKKDTTIETNLSATDQNNLINFIKNAYYKGKFNCDSLTNGTQASQCKMWDKLDVKEPPVNYTNCPSDVSKGAPDADKIIRKKHFNSFLKQLTNNQDPVSKMGRGEALENGNDATQKGPVLGRSGSTPFTGTYGTMSERTSYTEEKANNNVTNKSIITHDLWSNLADRASKLMYHPYQCDMCNIYEGGEFPEVVRELGSAIQANDPGYSWVKFSSVDVPNLGVTGISFRQDCSGFVSACIGVYRMLTYGGGYSTCNMVSGNFTTSDSSGLGDVKDDFCSSSQGGNIGCIYADSKHVEASDDNGKIWSGGGCGGGEGGACHEHPQMMHTGCGQKPLTWIFAASAGKNGSGGGNGTQPISWDIDSDDEDSESHDYEIAH